MFLGALVSDRRSHCRHQPFVSSPTVTVGLLTPDIQTPGAGQRPALPGLAPGNSSFYILSGMDFRWEPSVRTRHLAVIIALSLVAVGTITSFNLSRLVTLRIQDKARSHQALADTLFQIAQPEILDSPQADALACSAGTRLSRQ